jgi:inorganic pyrophosphatase
MIPYLFSAFTIRSVGVAAMGMVNEVRRQIKAYPGILTGEVEPDYKACIRIWTRSSLKEMIAPGVLVLSMPFILGFGFGPKLLSGFLPGAIVSGVQMAISASNTGGAWDNAKKYIESGALFN